MKLCAWSIDGTVRRITYRTGTVCKAAAVLTASLSLLLLGLAPWLIIMMHTMTLDAALFEVGSAFASSCLSLAFTTKLIIFGQIVIMVMMFRGSPGTLTIVATPTQQERTARVHYPAPVLIG